MTLKLPEQRKVNSILNEIEHKKVIHNFESINNTTHTLPAAKLGLEFEFLATGTQAYALIAKAAGTDVIMMPDGPSIAGGKITSSASNMSHVKLKCYIPGFWHCVFQTGIWTKA